MRLAAGIRLGAYEIVAPLGAGGMGEVYKARDTRLDRTVAIKILPADVAADPDRQERFRREARAISSLAHPHICALYDIGRQDGVDFLVMEHLSGETLAHRLLRGPLLLEEVVRNGAQIADALDTAHRHGLIHRDLKPANIMLTASGAKILDFGLAKQFSTDSDAAILIAATAHPTLTEIGTVVGTIQYMAPEQVEGRPADARSDIFALGTILYEMTTGRKAFDGASHAAVIGAILRDDLPPVSRVQSLSPPALDRLVARCVAKLPEERWQTAKDLLEELKWVGESRSQLVGPSIRPVNSGERVKWAAVALPMIALLAVALAALATVHFREKAPEPPEMRVDITTPPTSASSEFALSPDGKSIVFVASGDGPRRLWLRRLDQTTAQPLPGTEDASSPFWSPDSRSIAFSSAGELKRLDIFGGSPVVLAARIDRAGAWNAQGVILSTRLADLYRINATGEGEPMRVLQIPGAWIGCPEFLPDAKRFLFCVFSGPPDIRGTYIASLDGHNPKRLSPAEDGAAWLAPDRVVFMQQRSLWTRRLDLNRLEWIGDAELIADSVGGRASHGGSSGFSVSADGRIAYRKQASITQLTWLDREGKPSGRPFDPDSNGLVAPELSPDGKRVAVDRTVDGNRDVWLFDLVRGGMTRLTNDRAADGYPVWFSNGSQVAFESNRKGDFDVYVKPSTGHGEEQPLLELPGEQWPHDVSRDGRFLLYQNSGGVWALPLTGDDRKPISVATAAYNGQFSPDGRWVAFGTNESGREEVVVQPFPRSFGRWQISTSGGWWPRWSPDGQELYFVGDGKLMASRIRANGSSFEAEAPRFLFPVQVEGDAHSHPEYAVSRDGRFLVNQLLETTSNTPITLILNWHPERGK